MNFLNIKNKKWSLYIIETALILIGIVFRLRLYLYNQSFYMDECFLAANLVNKTYLSLFSPLDFLQSAPPFFMIICKFFLDISHQFGHLYRQDLALRFFPFFCSCASLPLFAIFLNKLSKNKIFVWICLAMLVFNNCAISYAVQFKQYSCELMFSIILLYIFHDFNINISNKKLLFYSLVICLSIWFSGTAIFLIIAGLIYICCQNLLISIIKSNLSKFLYLLIIPFIINFVAYYFIHFKPVYDALFKSMHFFWHFSFFTTDNFSKLFVEVLQKLIEVPILILDFIYFLSLNLLILLFRRDILVKVKFFIIFPILFIIVACFMEKYPFFQRLILYLLPMFIMLYCQLTYFVNYFDRKVIKILKILLIIVFVVLFMTKIKQPISNLVIYDEPTRAAAEFIKQNNIPANKVLIINDEYYIKAIFGKTKPIYYIPLWSTFNPKDITNFLKNAPKGDYWLINQIFLHRDENNESSQLKCLISFKNDKHLKILKTYYYNMPNNPEFIYITHFEKISDY